MRNLPHSARKSLAHGAAHPSPHPASQTASQTASQAPGHPPHPAAFSSTPNDLSPLDAADTLDENHRLQGASVLLCMGTRPEIIKMAPVYHALREAGHKVLVLHTGQHESMAWPVYGFFRMQPDHVIVLQRASDSLAHLSALLLARLDAVLTTVAPRLVLVQGDTSSALMGALAAFYRHIPVGHVEAGLRTHDAYEPFPEEMNRSLIARLTRWHFAPTPQARANLLAEGIPAAHIGMIGNTVVDAARMGVAWLKNQPPGEVLPADLKTLLAKPPGHRLLLVTAHRRENWGAGIDAIAQALRELLVCQPHFEVVWPLHGNTVIGTAVRRVLGDLPDAAAARLHLCAPLDYPVFLWLLEACWLVLTDSGGVQEEACALHKPVLVLRDNTERSELIAAGGGLLVGTSRANIVAQTLLLAQQPLRYQRMQQTDNPFGDGHSGTAICQTLAREFNLMPAGPRRQPTLPCRPS